MSQVRPIAIFLLSQGPCLRYCAPVPTQLTASETAFLLAELYWRAGQGWAPDTRHQVLADFLGCHPEARDAAWDLWRTELELMGQDLGEPSGWLDFDFYEAVPME